MISISNYKRTYIYFHINMRLIDLGNHYPPASGKNETQRDWPRQDEDSGGWLESEIPSSDAHFRKLSRFSRSSSSICVCVFCAHEFALQCPDERLRFKTSLRQFSQKATWFFFVDIFFCFSLYSIFFLPLVSFASIFCGLMIRLDDKNRKNSKSWTF